MKIDTIVEEREVLSVQIKELPSRSNRRKQSEEEEKMDQEEDDTKEEGSQAHSPTTAINIENTPPCNIPGNWLLRLRELQACSSFSLWSESVLNEDNPPKHEVFTMRGPSLYQSKKIHPKACGSQ